VRLPCPDLHICHLLLLLSALLSCSVPWLDDAGNIRVNRGYRVQVRDHLLAAAISLLQDFVSSSRTAAAAVPHLFTAAYLPW
jgi:hypothetical protein